MLRLLGILLLCLTCGCQQRAQNEQKESQEDKIGYGSTLRSIKKRGNIRCGVNTQLPGFGFLNEKGEYSGFDVDFCRALSSAIFGNPTSIEFRPLSSKERFTALQTGEIDILIRNTTHTLTRETDLGANFAPTIFYDGQGMMVRKDSNIQTLKDLQGASIGVQTGTTTELNLADQMAKFSVRYTPIVFETADELFSAYDTGRVDGVTTDRSALTARRTTLKQPQDHVILEEVMSKEPLAPMVRHGDDQWLDIIHWVVYTTFAAEEYGVNSTNAAHIKNSTTDPRVRKLLGVEGEIGEKIGLHRDWAFHIIQQVGNYKEIYERNLGENTPFNLPRGLNRVYNDTGILYAPPFR